tara:strand:+ start:1292 stop:1756 length:465 start_codon:yes stop_codon:yes gene_type:complete
MARPSLYTQKKADQVLARLACGESMRSVSRDKAMPSMTTLFKWLRENVEFTKQYGEAKREAADALFEDIIDIVDNESKESTMVDGIPSQVASSSSVAHARLRVDARKWVAGKLAPRKYGDKVEIEADEVGQPIAIVFDVNPAVSEIKITKHAGT